ncbi:hypothetical protein C8R45DRAFT_1163316 [Mycena sanguinolenta]|nr:hypothetical protein C8R45DRAFT_1163316 [Mycena sanguinolenta]
MASLGHWATTTDDRGVSKPMIWDSAIRATVRVFARMKRIGDLRAYVEGAHGEDRNDVEHTRTAPPTLLTVTVKCATTGIAPAGLVTMLPSNLTASQVSSTRRTGSYTAPIASLPGTRPQSVDDSQAWMGAECNTTEIDARPPSLSTSRFEKNRACTKGCPPANAETPARWVVCVSFHGRLRSDGYGAEHPSRSSGTTVSLTSLPVIPAVIVVPESTRSGISPSRDRFPFLHAVSKTWRAGGEHALTTLRYRRYNDPDPDGNEDGSRIPYAYLGTSVSHIPFLSLSTHRRPQSSAPRHPQRKTGAPVDEAMRIRSEWRGVASELLPWPDIEEVDGRRANAVFAAERMHIAGKVNSRDKGDWAVSARGGALFHDLEVSCADLLEAFNAYYDLGLTVIPRCLLFSPPPNSVPALFVLHTRWLASTAARASTSRWGPSTIELATCRAIDSHFFHAAIDGPRARPDVILSSSSASIFLFPPPPSLAGDSHP